MISYISTWDNLLLCDVVRQKTFFFYFHYTSFKMKSSDKRMRCLKSFKFPRIYKKTNDVCVCTWWKQNGKINWWEREEKSKYFIEHSFQVFPSSLSHFVEMARHKSRLANDSILHEIALSSGWAKKIWIMSWMWFPLSLTVLLSILKIVTFRAMFHLSSDGKLQTTFFPSDCSLITGKTPLCSL